MFTSNPFAVLSASIPAVVMQWYIILMILLVIGGTILDMIHKKSAQYFFENAKKAQKSAKRTVGGGEKASIAIQVLAKEVLTSGEFCNVRRRLSHLLTMYGFIIFVVTTAVMIFGYPTPATPAPAILPQLWHIGADALHWWLLVLVLYPRGRGSRRSDLASLGARGFVHPLAADHRDVQLDLVLYTVARFCLVNPVLRVVHHFKHNIVWRRIVVQVRAYVL